MVQKILMLHGYGQSGSILKGHSAKFRRSLEAYDYEFHYPDGPILLNSEEFDMGESKIDRRAWWITDKEKNDVEFERSVAVLKEFISKNGPFVGAVGFSQGSMILQLIIQKIDTEFGNLEPLSFAIFVCGVVKLELMPSDSHYLIRHKIKTPSLYLLAKYDQMIDNEKAKKTIEKISDETERRIVEFNGTHNFPSKSSIVGEMIEFVRSAGLPSGDAK